MEILFIIWAVCVLAGAAVMHNKGRSALGGAVWGLFLGVIGVVICFFYSESIEHKARKQLLLEHELERQRRNRGF